MEKKQKKPKKKTAGEISLELSQKTPEKISVVEQQEAMTEDYMKTLLDTVDQGYKKYDKDFFVIVLTKNERLMTNIFRNYFFARQSCPTPDYDQTVFKYNREAGQIEYLWTIPSKDACIHLKDNALQVSPEEKQLLYFVLMFFDGTLMKMAKKLNGEMPDSPLLVIN